MFVFTVHLLDRLRRCSGLLGGRFRLGQWPRLTRILGDLRCGRWGRGGRARRLREGRRRTLHIAHLPVDAFDDVVVHKQVGDDAVLRRLQVRRGLEAGGEFQEALGQRDGQVDGVTALRTPRWHCCAWQLTHIGHGLVDILAVTPAQVAAPVQLEALPVAVRRADGEPVARQEVWSPRAALGQSLRLVQLLTLRTLMCSRGGHANISWIQERTQPRLRKLQDKRKGRDRGEEGSLRSTRLRGEPRHWEDSDAKRSPNPERLG